MMEEIRLNKNHIVTTLGKSSSEFTKDDIIRYVEQEGIEMINFMYPAGDGRLKTLNFIINDAVYLDMILSYGERIDGSSLFAYIEPGNSDLYVMPRFKTAFRDPFAELPTVTMLCTFFDKDGNRLDNSPEYILEKACMEFRDTTGLEFDAMGELEFYVIAPDDGTFPASDQHGYHESAPFAKFNEFRTLCMSRIAATGGRIKYGHSEVGNFTMDGNIYEQNEIEFLPVLAQDAADQLIVAKWVIRNTAHEMGYDVTFAPKITTGKAGSGLHIHMRLTDPATGCNMMLNADKTLSDDAKKMIAGMMTMAQSLTAFGNCNPTSYFRLVPHQEAPTSICWGDRNRSVLIRVPLGWTTDRDMCAAINPGSKASTPPAGGKQTIEIRSADGSANVYLLIASLAVACRQGWQLDRPLEVAEKTYVDVNIHKAENKERMEKLKHLPTCCEESAGYLDRDRLVYEEFGVFPTAVIDHTVAELRSFDDATLHDQAKNDRRLMEELVNKYLYIN
ncbi:MAG: glutamine synthetase family protein [Bacteroides sp.]|nr:glutamine synthetase family protein [Bacteroides sp.]MCM1413342.1 glutamine synthetase family protein [Bacteroides sp.]MCM1471972.1 glutamine synthetase family protein [Bacteroides sp.]